MKSASASSSSRLTMRTPSCVERAGGGVRVIGDHGHVERGQPLGDQRADPAEAEDADHLVLQLDAGIGRPLPLPVLQRGHRLRHVPGQREQQRDGMLGGADDVRRWRVHHHHAGLGGRFHVDVVQAHARARDHAQPAAAAMASASIVVALRTITASTSAQRRQQLCSGPRRRCSGPRRRIPAARSRPGTALRPRGRRVRARVSSGWQAAGIPSVSAALVKLITSQPGAPALAIEAARPAGARRSRRTGAAACGVS